MSYVCRIKYSYKQEKELFQQLASSSHSQHHSIISSCLILRGKKKSLKTFPLLFSLCKVPKGLLPAESGLWKDPTHQRVSLKHSDSRMLTVWPKPNPIKLNLASDHFKNRPGPQICSLPFLQWNKKKTIPGANKSPFFLTVERQTAQCYASYTFVTQNSH